MAIDDRIRQELEQVSQAHDQLHLFEDVARRARRRRRVRRTARVLIAVSVVAGTGIAFVLLMHLFGGNRKVPATLLTPAAGPKNGKIVFAGITQSHQGQHLFMVSPDGTGLQQLTFGDDVLDESPDWSPDGTKIVFRRDDHGTLKSGIFVLDVESGTLTRIADGRDPTWSPDGTKIAFDTVQGGQCVIAVVNIDGSNEAALTDDRFFCPGDPDWSPDGTEIVFEANTPDVKDSWDVYAVHPDGTGLRDVTNTPNPGESEVWPKWSPDGRYILVGRGPGAMSKGDVHLYYLMTPNGEIVRQVNDGKSFDQEPSWSPDGRFILFDSDRAGHTNVWTLEVGDGELRQVTIEGGFLADWQPVPPGD